MNEILSCIQNYFLKETDVSDSDKSDILKNCLSKLVMPNGPILTLFDNTISAFFKISVFFGENINKIKAKDALLLLSVFLEDIRDKNSEFKENEKEKLYGILHDNFVIPLLREKQASLDLLFTDEGKRFEENSVKVKVNISSDGFSIVLPRLTIFLGKDVEIITRKYLVSLLKYCLSLKDDALFIFLYENFPIFTRDHKKNLHQALLFLAREVDLVNDIYDDLVLLDARYTFLNQTEGKLSIFTISEQKMDSKYCLWSYLTHGRSDVHLRIRKENRSVFIDYSDNHQVCVSSNDLAVIFTHLQKMRNNPFKDFDRLKELKSAYDYLNGDDIHGGIKPKESSQEKSKVNSFVNKVVTFSAYANQTIYPDGSIELTRLGGDWSNPGPLPCDETEEGIELPTLRQGVFFTGKK